MSDRNEFKPIWVQDFRRIHRELERMGMMFKKLRKNTADEELRELAQELELRSYTLGERYVSLGNEDALK